MSDPIGLSVAQSFERERMARMIRECQSLEDLRRLAEQLLSAWMVQRAAALWAIDQIHQARADGYPNWIDSSAGKLREPQ
jgi:hypothetical protein